MGARIIAIERLAAMNDRELRDLASARLADIYREVALDRLAGQATRSRLPDRSKHPGRTETMAADLPTESVLAWAVRSLAPDARVVGISVLHDRPGPWWLWIETGGTVRHCVLRVAERRSAQLATAVAALSFAESHGIAAPRLIAASLDGGTLGVAMMLETALPGTSSVPPTMSPARLRDAGAAIARVHAVRLDPRPDLPLRTRPTEVDDRAMERRWATLYRASRRDQRRAVVAALCRSTGWSPDRAHAVVTAQPATPLLQLADERIRLIDRPWRPLCFVHGDVWSGNLRWDRGRYTALIDWYCAGAGHPGVDLGELRFQMGYQYGLRAADHVLDGWQQQAKRDADHIAYWDIVAALNTPVDMAGWPAFDEEGKSLDAKAVIQRRDVFLSSALDHL